MAFRIRPIRVPIIGVDKFSKEFGAISKKLTKAGQSLTQVGQKMTRNVTLPVVAAGAAILATAGDFEASMNQVGVLTNANAKQFEMLEKRARELGATTQFSASEAADGMISLAMAGLDVGEVYKAIPGSLQLAAAAGIGLGEAADIATNIMTPFGKTAKDLTAINDALANTFTRTNTNMVQLAEAMTFVAPIAGPMKISLNETAAALGLMSKSGLKASRAGTSLRGILSRLVNPSREAADALTALKIPKENIIDAKGNVRSLIDVVRAFEEAGAGPAELLKIFGDRAGPGMAALVKEGSKSLETLTGQTKIEGRAAEVAEARMKGLFGQLKALKSAAQELAISFGEAGLLDAATKLVTKITGLIRRFSQASAATKNFILWTGGILAAIGPVLTAIGVGIKIFGFWAGVIAKIAPILAVLKGVLVAVGSTLMAVITSPVTLFIAAAAIWINNIRLIVKHWDELISAFESKFMFFQTLSFFLADIANTLANIIEKIPFAGKIAEFFKLAGKGFELEAAERAAVEFGGATRNVTTTNNAEVLVKVQSEGIPVRAERRSGQNLRLQTDTGLAFAGG
jgi:TP901 family phage tail tape measure protein